MSYHTSIMLDECIEGLNIKENGIYVDLTFGGGGHSKAILEKLKGGHLYAFDQDEDAGKNAQDIDSSSFTFIQSNFRYLKKYLKFYGVNKVDGILADLGVSSHQINEATRGFSTRFEGPLDMRMGQSTDKTAEQVLNEYSEQELHKILGMYGEVKNAKTLAAEIVRQRVNSPLRTIGDFKNILSRYASRGRENKYFAQVFQAVRIEVNEELKVLEEMLGQSEEVLKEGGRLAVMSFHSLEDRIVKNYVNKGKVHGDVEKDIFGNLLRPFQPVNKKPITAKEEELKLNNRARSAKLRVAEKL
ncbi:16S rRNA (cytosine(1402)-N(4))-methyltransferase RsmH [Reichenbachiella sp. MALMAid0571]|uniref:16S rRNA (cytosine(1402)-N(4))-methyltransferase RsmH n=1 Tax=Reichenbachiella sp. MALMAid0571 TaxID=3143939 RepID=UPI0032DFFDE6